MIDVLLVFVAVIAFIGWIVLCVCLCMWADDCETTQGSISMYGSAAVLFAFPVAIFMVALSREPHPDELCRRGHEIWQSSGKTISKHWVCDEWDSSPR